MQTIFDKAPQAVFLMLGLGAVASVLTIVIGSTVTGRPPDPSVQTLAGQLVTICVSALSGAGLTLAAGSVSKTLGGK